MASSRALLLFSLCFLTACGSPEPPPASCESEPEGCATTAPKAEATLLSLSPGTIDGSAPEVLTALLRVEDRENFDRFLQGNGRIQVLLSTPEGPLAIDEIDHHFNDQDLFEVRFTPPLESAQRGILRTLQIQGIDTQDQLHFQERTHLRYQDGLPRWTPSRDLLPLDQLHNPTRVWTLDLDGDGVDDRLLFDQTPQGPALALYRCSLEGFCSYQQHHPLPSGAPISAGSTAPLAINDPGSLAPPGFLYATLEEAGALRRVQVTHLFLEPDTGIAGEESVSIDLSTADATQWRIDTLRPRWIEDADGTLLLGIAIVSFDPDQDLATLHLIDEGKNRRSHTFSEIPGITSEDSVHFLSRPYGLCFPPGNLSPFSEAIDATVVTTTLTNEGPRQVALSTASGSSASTLLSPSPSALQPTLIDCKLRDINADGSLDLAFSITEEDGSRALFLAANKDSTPADRAFHGAQLLLDGIDPDREWEIFGIRKIFGIATVIRTLLFVAEPQKPHRISSFFLPRSMEGPFELWDLSSLPLGPGLAVFSPDAMEVTESIHSIPHFGFRRIRIHVIESLRHLQTPLLGGPFAGATFFGTPDGYLVQATLDSSLVPGSDEALLEFRPPQSITALIDPRGNAEIRARFAPGARFRWFSYSPAAPLVGTHFDYQADQTLLITSRERFRREINVLFSSLQTEQPDVLAIQGGLGAQEESMALVMVLADGTIAYALFPTRGPLDSIELQPTGYRFPSGAEARQSSALRLLSTDSAPLLILRDVLDKEDALQPLTVLALQDDVDALSLPDTTLLIGDFQGTGLPQILRITQDSYRLFPLDGDFRLPHLRDAEPRGPLSFSSDDFTIVDLNHDGCDDLLSPDGEAIISRCDGTFQPHPLSVGAMAAFITSGDGFEPAGLMPQDYNSSRSNKANGIAFPLDDLEDAEESDLGSPLPSFDGLMFR